MIAMVGVTVPIHIREVSDIPSLRIIFNPFEYIETHPATYDRFHRTVLLQDK